VNTSCNIDFLPGTVVVGKWHKRKYVIAGLLGEGANGKVYLAKERTAFYALKMGYNTVDLQSEINVLISLAAITDPHAPFLIDTDDVSVNGNDIAFYVMKYIRGSKIEDYLNANGEDWLFVIGKNILWKLHRLHSLGWIFGDLKMDNIIVGGYGNAELVDYGGVTRSGRAVRQFTEIYDRGFWGAGSRTADEAYDIFAFAVLCIQLSDSQHRIPSKIPALPQHRSPHYLLEVLQSISSLKPVASVLQKALTGTYSSSFEAFTDWKRAVMHLSAPKKQAGKIMWLPGAFTASIILFASALYLVLR
jgi:serine/threonine protein kinase